MSLYKQVTQMHLNKKSFIVSDQQQSHAFIGIQAHKNISFLHIDPISLLN